jgi:integrase
MRAHNDTTVYGESGAQMAHRRSRGVGKNDSRYWHSKIFRRVDPRGIKAAHYTARIQWRGGRHYFALGTANKEAAAAKAATIWRDLVSHGIEATLAKHKSAAASEAALAAATTIGEWIAAASKIWDGNPATFGSYARALRFIASEILAFPKSRKRLGRTQASAYREQVDGAPLAMLSAQAVQAWRIQYINRAGGNPARQRAARISCNSALRLARSLFSRRILKFVDPKIVPAELPFRGVELFSRESMRYQSKFDPATLLRTAVDELDPNALKVLLLALCVGLRRGEIDRLLWRQVDFDRRLIRVEVTEAGALKTENSAGAVQIDEELAALLRGFRARAKGEHVIDGGQAKGGSASYGQRYRCLKVFVRLIGWLRAHGITARRAIHELRKEAGSIVATQSGIHAASRFLRHSDIQITAACYADHKERITVPLGALLKPDNVADMPQAAERRAAQ